MNNLRAVIVFWNNIFGFSVKRDILRESEYV